MKKSKAFLFITALIAVAMSASMASAVQYAYVSNDSASIGTIEVATDGTITQNAASKSFDMTGVSLFSAGENVLAVGTYSNKTRFVLLDKSLTVVNSADVAGSLSVADAAMFNKKLIINEMSGGRLIEVDTTAKPINTTNLASIDISGSMVVNGSTLYAAGFYQSGSKNKVVSITSFPAIADSADIATNTEIYGLTLANGTIYAGGSVSDGDDVDSIPQRGIYTLNTSSLAFTKLLSTDTEVYSACSDGSTGLYFLAGYTGNMKIYHLNGTTSIDVTSDDVSDGTTLAYDSASQTLSVITSQPLSIVRRRKKWSEENRQEIIGDSLGQLAVYALTSGKFALVDSKDVYSAAKFETASTPATKGDAQGVDVSKLSTDVANNIANVFGVASTDIGDPKKLTASESTSASTGLESNIKKNANYDIASVSLPTFTASETKWYLISTDISDATSIVGSVDVSNFKVYFADTSKVYTSAVDVAALDGNIQEAKLMDITTGKELTSGKVPAKFYTGAKLSSGTSYGMYAATASSSGGSNSSSGGCNAGFAALSALMVLAFSFFKKH